MLVTGFTVRTEVPESFGVVPTFYWGKIKVWEPRGEYAEGQFRVTEGEPRITIKRIIPVPSNIIKLRVIDTDLRGNYFDVLAILGRKETISLPVGRDITISEPLVGVLKTQK